MCSQIIVVTGPPGAGKTTLATNLSQELELPFIGKDDFKDILFDTLGWKDRQWSMRLGQASFEILFHCLEGQLKVGKSAIVETAFIPQYHNSRFRELRDTYGFKPIQVVCRAGPQILYQRFITRTETNERHPGHVDHLTTYDQFVKMLSERNYGILDIGGPVVNIDTTDFDTVDMDHLVATIAQFVDANSFLL